ncbi:hypothetical protein [Turneriella parva]|uniref:GIY-YIG domain-containing protein n=1 Tax=Turneriella parva (strain ATCC BAA-1111 / DSM 21527 / NCTC 11395 / H) TaxID=869212 RepID=I4B9I9_TURPD|nr:hypothetical protein [Turneriella parva]AFM13946.1 hypothetical protein Turpa_3308 [Turneriella parva DSM 21527]
MIKDFERYKNIYDEVAEYTFMDWHEPRSFFSKETAPKIGEVGIYIFKAKTLKQFNQKYNTRIHSSIFYVGRTQHLQQRMRGHFRGGEVDSAPVAKKILEKLEPKFAGKTYKALAKDKTYKAKLINLQAQLVGDIMVSFIEETDHPRQALKEILFSLRFESDFNAWHTH